MRSARETAKALGEATYISEAPCKNGHTGSRYVNCRTCVECAKERSKKRFETDKERHNQSSRIWSEKNKHKRAEYNRRWYSKAKHIRAAQAARWRENNPDKMRALDVKYRLERESRCPKWLTDEDKRVIMSIYQMANRVQVCLGIPHHVDHIIPLKGKDVCGLHVPWNLRVLPASLNLRKSNKLLDVFGTTTAA